MTRFIQAVLMSLGLLLVVKLALADTPVPAGSVAFSAADCQDRESKQVGQCVMLLSPAGDIYITFHQEQRLVLVRRLVGSGGYVTVWTAENFGTI